MNEQRDLEQTLRAHLEARAERTVLDGQLATILDQTTGRRQRPAWLAALRSPSAMTATTIAARAAVPRMAWLLAAVGLLVGLAFVAAIVGAPRTPTPLNGRIVFGRVDAVLREPRVYAVNPDGSRVVELTSGVHEGPAWSPDGELIGMTDAVMNADGSGYQPRDFSQSGLFLAAWDWSPDGQRLLMEGWEDADDGRTLSEGWNNENDILHGIYTVRASDGGDLLRLSESGDFGVHGSYSRDGQTVAYTGTFEGAAEALILVSVDGTNRRRVGDLQGGSPTWAPDGRSLLFTSGDQLFSVVVATGTVTVVRATDVPDLQVSAGVFSPDGTRILFVGRISGGNVDLYTMRADGTDLVQVTNTPDEERFMDWGIHPLDE